MEISGVEFAATLLFAVQMIRYADLRSRSASLVFRMINS
jgi:hypothetical protein